MNVLAYGLLSLLSKGPSSGYDLMRQLSLFWNASHSQIYPLLATLEKMGCAQYELVPQTDKPDKKVYTITDRGVEALRGWMLEPTCEPAVRDELVLKLYCLPIGGSTAAISLLEERLALYRARREKYEAKVETLRGKYGPDMAGIRPDGDDFGSYLLIAKGIMTADLNIDWCQWAIALLREKGDLAQ